MDSSQMGERKLYQMRYLITPNFSDRLTLAYVFVKKGGSRSFQESQVALLTISLSDDTIQKQSAEGLPQAGGVMTRTWRAGFLILILSCVFLLTAATGQAATPTPSPAATPTHSQSAVFAGTAWVNGQNSEWANHRQDRPASVWHSRNQFNP